MRSSLSTCQSHLVGGSDVRWTKRRWMVLSVSPIGGALLFRSLQPGDNLGFRIHDFARRWFQESRSIPAESHVRQPGRCKPGDHLADFIRADVVRVILARVAHLHLWSSHSRSTTDASASSLRARPWSASAASGKPRETLCATRRQMRATIGRGCAEATSAWAALRGGRRG